MRNVENKVAFITGGSSGIGQGILRVLVAAKMKVAFSYRQEKHLHETMQHFEINEKSVLPVKLDVTDRDGMEKAAENVYAAFGNVDLLINNAAVNMFTPMDEASHDDWDWILDVNLKGIINSLVTFLPRMKGAGKGGHIVNTASMGSFIAGPSAGIYTTSKFAVRGLTECLRYCLAEHKIGVSLLCPGLVVSNICNSEELRPTRYSNRGGPLDLAKVEYIKRIQALGMDPMTVGERTLAGIRNNDLYIFTHPDHKAELRESFEEILSAFPDGDLDPKRAPVEEQRRKRINELKALIASAE